MIGNFSAPVTFGGKHAWLHIMKAFSRFEGFPADQIPRSVVEDCQSSGLMRAVGENAGHPLCFPEY